MNTLMQALLKVADEYKDAQIAEEIPTRVITVCTQHAYKLIDGKCPMCEEDKQRGYETLTLAGRCANGCQRDSGTRWHAVEPGQYKAICGATYGRRSVGWSSWRILHQPVTCPRCVKKLEKRK